MSDLPWPEYMRDEIAAIEKATGVTFTWAVDPVRAAAEMEDRWHKDKEFYRWHRFDGELRKLRKNGKPYWRQPSKRYGGL